MKNIFEKNGMMNDLKEVVADTEALMKATANTGGEKFLEVRHKVEQSLNLIKDRLAENKNEMIAKTRAAVEAGDHYVHENPWRSIGFAASIGVVIGLLIGRR